MDHLLLRTSGCSKPGNSWDTLRDILMLNREAVTSQRGQDISTSIRSVQFCAVQVVASHKKAHPDGLSTQEQVCSLKTGGEGKCPG